jgi:TolB-like protein/tetratricopeptide (TPR) repeat protein
MGEESASGDARMPNDPPGAVPVPTGGTELIAPNHAPPGHGYGHHPHIVFKFFEELKHRNVVRVAVLYLLACWLILDPVHVVFHMLEVPAWANRLVVILMAIGFPAVLLFAWVFEITPEGLKPTVDVEPHRSIRPLTGRRLDRAIMVVMAIAIAYFVADKFWLSKHLPAATSEQASAQEAKVPAAPPPAMATVDKSIAVLPFVDMSEKKDQEYFSDGLSEELIDRLAQSPDLRVIARTSCFFFKGKQTTISEIAKTLGVSHVLEGSVRKAGHVLRVTAQLIRASDGSHLWSQTYDRDPVDIFKVQDEIAGTVAQALNTTLTSATGRGQPKSVKPEAYNLVLLGNYFANRGSDADTEKAKGFYKDAIRLDPSYALAWAKLGAITDFDTPEGRAEATSALQRALQLDPNLAVAYSGLEQISVYTDFNWSKGKAELERAIELNPNDFHYRAELAWLTEGRFGVFDNKIRYLRQAVSNDPLDSSSQWHLAVTYSFAGEFEESAAAYRRLLELNPTYFAAQTDYGATLLLMRRYPEALAAVEKEPLEPYRLWGLAIVHWGLGRESDSNAELSRIKEKFMSHGISAWRIARAYAYRGQNDAALEWLGRSYQQHEQGMTLLAVDPFFRNLRTDPGYQALLVKMKLDNGPPGSSH